VEDMIHAMHEVIDFHIVEPYSLVVRFEENTEQTIDFSSVLFGSRYGPLRDISLFN
jgi:hypothetical protein